MYLFYQYLLHQLTRHFSTCVDMLQHSHGELYLAYKNVLYYETEGVIRFCATPVLDETGVHGKFTSSLSQLA